MSKRMMIALSIWILAALPLAAAPQRVAQDQQTMNRQAERDYRQADVALNRVYKKLLSGLPADRRKLLVAAQQSWIRFRGANALLWASENEGGSIYPLVYNGALARMTRARTKELQEIMGGPEGR